MITRRAVKEKIAPRDEVEDLEETAKANRWSRETKLLQLPCLLRGAALDWFEIVEEEDMEFEESIEQLNNVFTNANDEGRSESDDDEAGKDPFCSEGTTAKDKIEMRKTNLMGNRTLEKLGINIRRVKTTSFLLKQSLREPGPGTSSEKEEIRQLRRQMNNLESKL
ncbi:hypothetical protein Trydic_g15244 [Trypoxylus dichotomus]